MNRPPSLQKVARAKIELLKRQAWNDFYVFAKYVCGNDLMEEIPHRELCEFATKGLDKLDHLELGSSGILNVEFKPVVTNGFVIEQEGKSRKLIMLPRGAFKSTVITVALTIWLMWHNPSLRIMIDSEVLGNAKKYLAAIKDLIANNEMLRLICVNQDGDYVLEPNYKIAGGFTDDQIILKHRTKLGLKEPTIFCAGVDNAQTGMHPDVIIMDDLVSERNIGTDTQIQKVKDHYKFSLSLLEPGGLQIVVGTRYHMADLYGDLLKLDSFETMVRPAIDENGEPYFPTRLTKEFLDDMRQSQGTYIFNCQYMLSPVDDSEAMFKQQYMQYYHKPPAFVEKYILTDLAISQKETADYTVILPLGVTKDKKIYVLPYERGRFEPGETINKLFDMYLKHRGLTKAVGIESVAFQKAMLYFVRDEMRRRGIYMPLVELKADRDKKRRIGALQPLFENLDIFIPQGDTALVNELLEFPFSAHDDIADALAYLLQVMRPGQYSTKPLEYAYESKGRSVFY